MANRLNNKRAIVTGAAAGIGRKTVEVFVREGAEVWAVDIDAEALGNLQKHLPSIHTTRTDVTNTDAITQLEEQIQDIDILFNCAGYVHHGSILKCDREAWDFSMTLNVTAAYEMTRTFLPTMIGKGAGSIINMSSVASSIKGVPHRLAYGVSKAAVIGLTRSVAADYVGQGIRCNAICPGTVDTPSLRQRIAAFPDPVEAKKNFIARQPMGRLGTDQEIAELALYLASDESSYTTGSVITIDGGWSM